MGVCPQFDVLWGELTGLEHLRLYGRIKVRVPAACVQQLVFVPAQRLLSVCVRAPPCRPGSCSFLPFRFKT